MTDAEDNDVFARLTAYKGGRVGLRIEVDGGEGKEPMPPIRTAVKTSDLVQFLRRCGRAE